MTFHHSGLFTEIQADGLTVRLTKPYTITLPDDGGVFYVPRNFVTDFASVPRVFWRVIPPWGKYSPAAVVHDYLYSTHQIPRKDADLALLAIMAALGVPPWKRRIMYWAVRAFGQAAWNAGRNAGGKAGK